MAIWLKIISVLAITTLIFLAGFQVGNLTSDFQLNTLRDLKDELAADTAALDAEFSLLSSDPCRIDSIKQFGKRLDLMDSRLYAAEKKLGFTSKLDPIKTHYFASEIKHLLLVEQVNKQCINTTKFIPALYFYSNVKCAFCLEQGKVLSLLKSQNPQLMVYSFDAENPSTLIETLKKQYAIKELPTIVINNQTLSGLQSEAKLKEALEATHIMK